MSPDSYRRSAPWLVYVLVGLGLLGLGLVIGAYIVGAGAP